VKEWGVWHLTYTNVLIFAAFNVLGSYFHQRIVIGVGHKNGGCGKTMDHCSQDYSA
jgi:hypothetical protein